ncbi:hypothetical protein DY000_02046712 [Brassica cretica]|uniref:Uncharacterized protein n=1 Tax=Brassica cretica TaxID=69181 RepID=A0ABQ7EUG8_BRACR|nr:hypothetical protein DY000_02046712 [Brassica cretica]
MHFQCTTQNIQVVTEDDLGNPSQTTKHKRTNALLMNAGSVHDLFVVLLMAMADLYIIIIIPRSQNVLILCCLVYVFSAQKKTRRLTKPNPEVPLTHQLHPVAYCNNLEKHDYKDSDRGKDLFVVLLMAMADLYIIIIIPRSQNVLILCCLVYVFSAQKKTRRLTKPNPEVPLTHQLHPVAYCNNLEKHDYKDSDRGKGFRISGISACRGAGSNWRKSAPHISRIVA